MISQNIEKHIIVNNTDFLKHKYLDRGCSGVCYITKDGQVYKEFNPYLEEYYFLCEFTKIKNDSVVFPNELVYLDISNVNAECEFTVVFRRSYTVDTAYAADYDDIIP